MLRKLAREKEMREARERAILESNDVFTGPPRAGEAAPAPPPKSQDPFAAMGFSGQPKAPEINVEFMDIPTSQSAPAGGYMGDTGGGSSSTLDALLGSLGLCWREASVPAIWALTRFRLAACRVDLYFFLRLFPGCV